MTGRTTQSRGKTKADLDFIHAATTWVKNILSELRQTANPNRPPAFSAPRIALRHLWDPGNTTTLADTVPHRIPNRGSLMDTLLTGHIQSVLL